MKIILHLVVMRLRVSYTLVEILFLISLRDMTGMPQYVHITVQFNQLRSKGLSYYLETLFVRQLRGQSVAGQRYHEFGLDKRVKTQRSGYIIAQCAFNLAIIDGSVQINL
jgi:hypothetical protein